MDRQGVDRKPGSPRSPLFEAEEARNHGVLLLYQGSVLVPHMHKDEVPIHLGVMTPTRQDGRKILFAIKGRPRVLIRPSPFLGSHMWVLDRRVERIPLIKIGVHPLTTLLHFQVIVGSRQRGQHEEGCLIRLDDIHEILDVEGHPLFRIEGKADDVPGVNGNAGIVPLSYNLHVLLDLVLWLSLSLAVLRVYALHAAEHLAAAGLSSEAAEVLWLARQGHLHHKGDIYAFVVQSDDGFKGLTPPPLPGKAC